MASLPNRISKPEPEKHQVPTFQRSLIYSLSFHFALALTFLIFSKFNVSVWKKPIPQASVVWTQTVKRPAPTIPDKLPPPLVPIKKPEPPKEEEVNIKKKPQEVVKKQDDSRSEKMKKALEKLKKNVVEDDRPAPREDNFPTADPKANEGNLSDTEILALQSSSIYSAYVQQLKELVQNNFIWYKAGEQFVTIVTMNIDPQGNVSNIKVEKSSGDFSYDQAVLRAVQKSNPMPPPPPELVQMFLQERVEINFERKNS